MRVAVVGYAERVGVIGATRAWTARRVSGAGWTARQVSHAAIGNKTPQINAVVVGLTG
jgi:hypothetical protein